MKRTSTLLLLLAGIVAGRHPALAQTIPNAGFEQWQLTAGLERPVGWTVSDDAGLGCTLQTSAKTADGLNGTLAILLQTSFCTNFGGIHEGYAYAQMAVTNKPDSLRFWYKSARTGNDSARVTVDFYQNQTRVGGGVGFILTSQSTYKRMSFPLTYSGPLPDMAVVFLSSDGFTSPVSGNRLWIDDVAFVTRSTGIATAPGIMSRLSCYPLPAGPALHIGLRVSQGISGRIMLSDLSGRRLISADAFFNAGDNVQLLDTAPLASGIYQCTVQLSNGERQTCKVIK